MKHLQFTILFFVFSTSLLAQDLIQSGVLSMKLKNSGVITKNEQVTGYYLFHKQEQKDSKSNNYLLTVVDENLREINKVNITRPTTYLLIEGTYNGSAFGFMFYDTWRKTVEVVSFDETLQQLGSDIRKVKCSFALDEFKQIALGYEPMRSYLVPVENRGFLFYSIIEAGSYSYNFHFQMDYFDNTMKVIWTERSKPTASIESAIEAFQSKNFVGSFIEKRISPISSDSEYDLLINHVDTGERLFRIPIGTREHIVSISNVYYDSLTSNFIVFGEYYNRLNRSNSLGFITLVYDLTGKIVSQKANLWDEEIKNAIPKDQRYKFFSLNANILVHEVIHMADGQIFIIGEQYKKVASGGGIAATLLLGPGIAVSQINVYNMVIFEFNADFSIKHGHIFEKEKNKIALPSGSGFLSAKRLSFFAKSVGGFDYNFSQTLNNRNSFAVTFLDRVSNAGEVKNVLNSIVYTPEKKFTIDRIDLPKSLRHFAVFKAKEGYVLITEYRKEEKQMESRLEKINY